MRDMCYSEALLMVVLVNSSYLLERYKAAGKEH